MFARLFRSSPRRPAAAATSPTGRPALEPLEDRTTPTVSAITGNFNGTAIPAGDSLWFSSVAKVQNLPASGDTLHVTNQTITFTANGVPYSFAVPDTTVSLSPKTTDTTVTTDANGNWNISSPENFSGNVFLAGVSVPLPNGLPGGIKNVTWSGDFTADVAGPKVNWQWAAAAYTKLSGTDATALGLKPADQKTVAYPNSDHAGTPENFRAYVVGGATGGGGSNWTGSYSATAAVVPTLAPPPTQAPAQLSGTVMTADGVPEVQVQVTLSGQTAQGQFFTTTAYTDQYGMYVFYTIPPGTYTITETPPSPPNGLSYVGTTSTAGEINGTQPEGNASGTTISNVTLHSGDVGTQYDFVDDYALFG
jgi:hypothetical protein